MAPLSKKNGFYLLVFLIVLHAFFAPSFSIGQKSTKSGSKPDLTQEELEQLKSQLKEEIKAELAAEATEKEPAQVAASPTTTDNKLKFEIRPYFNWDNEYYNQVRDYQAETHQGETFNNLLGGLTYTAWPNERLTIQFAQEIKAYTNLPQRPAFAEDLPTLSYSAYPDVARAVWIFGDLDSPSWVVSYGMQYHKDNPDTKIMGDYLVKSMIYPSMIFTRPHRSDTRIMGLKVTQNLGGFFHHTVMIHSNFQQYPLGDINLGYMASANFMDNMFEVGAGVHWVSAIPFKPSKTTPKSTGTNGAYDNTYKDIPFQAGTSVLRVQDTIVDIGGGVMSPIKDTTLNIRVTIQPRMDSTGLKRYVNEKGFEEGYLIIENLKSNTRDSTSHELLHGKFAGVKGGTAPPSEAGYQNSAFTKLSQNNGINIYPELRPFEEPYSFSGQTVNLRAAFNPLHGKTSLGTDALKIYGEIALLGIKNYGGMYENRRERMPIMFGLNIPTFNLIDYLSAEAEYFPSKTEPSWYWRDFRSLPQPGGEPNGATASWATTKVQKRDDWKWGVSGRKNFTGFAVSVQAGTDHTHSPSRLERFQEILQTPYEWYTSIRLIIRL